MVLVLCGGCVERFALWDRLILYDICEVYFIKLDFHALFSAVQDMNILIASSKIKDWISWPLQMRIS